MALNLLRRRTAFVAAWAALVWERAAAVLWPALAFPAGFVVLALMGVWERTGDPWRALALAASLIAALVFAGRGLVQSPWPRARDARRRVEIDSELKGRPFEALDDTPAAPDPQARALWRVHQSRMRDSLKNVRARRPRAAFAAADVPAIRGVLTLAAVAGLVVAGAAASGRLLDAFALTWLSGGVQRVDIQAWIAPPDYTRRPPVFLRGDGGSFEAPAGSELIVRIVGARRAPTLRVEGIDGGNQRIAFVDDGPQAYAAKATLQEDSRVRVSGKDWSVRVLPDSAPGAVFAEGPAAGERQELTFQYLLDDDYGVATGALRITPTDEPGAAALEEPLDVPPNARSVDDKAELDLTEHPWAGREVELVLVARDALGQEGRSAPVVMELPERVFVDPLARAILEQRTTLFTDTTPYTPLPEAAPLTAQDAADAPPVQTDQTQLRIGRAPETVAKARRSLQLMLRGGELFEEDGVLHLGLSYAQELLSQARDRADFAELRDVLWDMALRAEGGDLADAERALREAERALARALARGDSPEEIARLMQEYQEAVQRYMEALTLQALQEGRVLSEFAGGQQMGGGQMGQDQLQQMLQALRDLAETGSNDDARRALAALSEMLRNMEVQLAMGQGGQGGQSQPNDMMSQELRDALQELADVLGRQREAMDQTQSQGQQGEQGQNGEGQQGAGQQNMPGQAPGGQQPGQQGQGGQQGGNTPGGQDLENGAGPGGQRPNGEPGGDQPGFSPEFGPGFNQLAEQQRAIREALGELLGQLENGEVSGGENGGEATEEALGRAEQAMRDAEEAMRGAEGALTDEDAQGALERQGEALSALRESLEAMAQGARSAERRAAGLNEDENPDRANRDPFGRNAAGSGLDVGNSVEVPDEMERRRARDILDELRRRSGETDRPVDELDYLRRLLERFR